MKTIILLSICCCAAFGQQKDWTIRGYSTTVVRHQVVTPGSFRVNGNTVEFLYKGIRETAEIPEYRDKELFSIDKSGKVTFEPEFWAGLDRARLEIERDEEWQRKGYPVEFRAFMIRTLKRLSVEKHLEQ